MKKQKPLISKNGEIRELSGAEIHAMRPAQEVLPKELLAVLPKVVVKQSITLDLDPEIVSYFKSTGRGWESRVNSFLKAAVTNLPLA